MTAQLLPDRRGVFKGLAEAATMVAPAVAASQTATLRERIAEEIEQLMAMLDEIDGDPDLEATALERYGKGFIASGHDDDEDTDDSLDWADMGEPEGWL